MENIIKSYIVVLLISILSVYGYINNIVKLTKCDFDRPVKAEVLRITGIVIAPIGCVLGYINIEDKEDK